MAKMIPETPKDFHGSKGEERVFRALRTLGEDVVVLHSFRWLHPGNPNFLEQRLNCQGEGDFVVIDPARGIMVIEVKGGEVSCEDGEWYQKNRATGRVQPINPEAQASDTKFRIRTAVIERLPLASDVLFCHAVWFPDGVVDRKHLPMNCHSSMTLDGESIAHPEGAIGRAFAYWNTILPRARGSGDQTKAILKILAPTFSIVRSVRQTIDEREEVFVQLTREQTRILDFLDEQLHAAIIGPAGTGKTMLAIEKARRLSSPTKPVLFLCFNAALRDHLRTFHAQPNVAYHSFHSLAHEIVGFSDSMDKAVQALLARLIDEGQFPYEHLIIDEAQDFEREWLEFLKVRFQTGAFYAFYDRYQAIQGQKETSWVDDIPCRLMLTRNCRNTDQIATAAYRAAGLGAAPTLGVDGPQPVLHPLSDASSASKVVDALVAAACRDHNIPPHEIAVLSLETIPADSPWSTTRLGGQKTSDTPKAGHVTVTTARKFKGLEATLLIIVDADFTRGDEPLWWRLLYVACSRARHAVHIVTTTQEKDIDAAVRSLTQSEKSVPTWRRLCKRLGIRLSGGLNDPFN